MDSEAEPLVPKAPPEQPPPAPKEPKPPKPDTSADTAQGNSKPTTGGSDGKEKEKEKEKKTMFSGIKKTVAPKEVQKEERVPNKEETSEENHSHAKITASPDRHKFPSNKPVDFQVRVRVIQGRQIAGANISPVVKVTVGNQARQTKVKKSTNRPYFDEMFFFNYQEIASTFFDNLISFEVFNSQKLRANALIGSFESDVGFFFDQQDHMVNRKWVLLTDPEDKMEGAKGYLKVTVIVLGPGDEAPVIIDKINHDDEDDLENNLLQPAGVIMRTSIFALKVYRAEDIPQMDSSFADSVKKVFMGEANKELVDPYVLVSFAGKQSRTRCHEKSDHPEFKEELFVSFRLPSMCERLKIQMYDWDRFTADDCIGTAYLPLSAISGQTEEEGIQVFPLRGQFRE